MHSLAPAFCSGKKTSPPSSIRRPETLDVVGEGLDLVGGVLVLVGAAVGEVDLGVGDGAVVGDLPRALLLVRGDDVGLGHRPLDVGRQLLHRVADGGVVDAVRRLEDDLALEAGAVPEAVVLEDVEGLLALGAGKLEVVAERAPGGAGERSRGRRAAPASRPAPAGGGRNRSGRVASAWRAPWQGDAEEVLSWVLSSLRNERSECQVNVPMVTPPTGTATTG